MFTGSMRGSGAVVFAVWTYVIAKMRSDKTVGVQVELRPDLLSFYIGESEQAVRDAILFLCKPDPDSTCQEEEGRRLVQLGKFSYRVVSGDEYMRIRSEEDLREYQRMAKRRERARKKGKPLPGEQAALKAEAAGDQKGAEAIAAERKPMTAKARAELLEQFRAEGNTSPEAENNNEKPNESYDRSDKID